ncbi:MAG: carboxypeptidase regulatory-like domain-containing protein [Bacteroidetes bacterium]|nr:carboxypeptidase regulatory-like domain-containing protein [Bacteroidota bacterium]
MSRFIYLYSHLFLFYLFLNSIDVSAQRSHELDSITQVLENVFRNDQLPRMQIDSIAEKYGSESDESKSLMNIIGRNDSINTLIVKEIIDKYGWLGRDRISARANKALFLVIQHADLSTQLRYKDSLEAASRSGRANPADYALLLDRTNMDQGIFQVYGSQLIMNYSGAAYLFPIMDEPNVNKRRKSVGLDPLEVYAKLFNVNYSLPAKDPYRNCFVLSGFIFDKSGNPVKDVSIINGEDVISKTDENGYFKTPIRRKIKNLSIRYTKPGYKEIAVSLDTSQGKDVYLQYIQMKD